MSILKSPVVQVLLLINLWGCIQSTAPCPSVVGSWIDKDGFVFVFLPDSSALWLTQFGNQYDTVRMRYKLNCNTKPGTLDFVNIENGPHRNGSLYGILEWTSDSTFRYRYEANERPDVFDSDQTLQFSRAPELQ